MKPKVAALVGATAVGKSAVALELAQILGAEIVSIDSMQIYRGMDIGTAKPSEREREAVPHHLVDLWDPDRVLTVSEYQDLARGAISDISRRGCLPLLVGGSGLYMRAVVDDLRFPPTEPDVRKDLEAEAEEQGTGVLYERLQELDPVAASRIEPGNARRIVRALEVIALTGERFSDNETWESYESVYELALAGLSRPRDELYERIAIRVEQMLAEGLLDEATELAPRLGTTARQALGYRQILDAPSASREEMAAAVVRATKRFARRQESWFRADPRVEWFEAGDEDLLGRLTTFFRSALALP